MWLDGYNQIKKASRQPELNVHSKTSLTKSCPVFNRPGQFCLVVRVLMTDCLLTAEKTELDALCRIELISRIELRAILLDYTVHGICTQTICLFVVEFNSSMNDFSFRLHATNCYRSSPSQAIEPVP